MLPAYTDPGQEMRGAARVRSARRRVGPGADGYVATLKAQLAITEPQSQVWATFAATLSANSRRMQRTAPMTRISRSVSLRIG